MESRRSIYRLASLEEILPLRESVIIQGTDRTNPILPGDHDPATIHMGAFLMSKNIGCLTLMKNFYEDQTAYQIRGMAVFHDYQRQGIGSALLKFTENWVVEHTDIRVLWCNARSYSVGFYTKHGWETVSDEFTIEGVGPHHRMVHGLVA